MATAGHRRQVADLLAQDDRTYAEAAGVTLRDTPKPLWQVMVLALLMSKPIDADMAVAAARELFSAGWRTPASMRRSTWQQRVDALGRAHYRRYDESTATRLEENADWVQRTYRGDLRRLFDAVSDAHAAEVMLTDAPGLGPTGAGIVLRECQAVRPELRPYADAHVADCARQLGIPHSIAGLVDLAGTTDLSRLAAVIVRRAHAERG